MTAKKKSNKRLEDKLILQNIEDAWLNIDVTEDELFNPLISIPEEFKEDEHLYITHLLTRPEYFSFICKEILNIELLPVQCAILAEFWKRKFPIFIGSRGFGKCQKNSIVITNKGFTKIESLIPNDYPYETKYYPENPLYLLGETGFNKVEYVWKKQPEETVKLYTNYRYRIEGRKEHPLRVIRDGKLKWIEMSNIQLGDILPIDRTQTWHPECNSITPEEGYWMGALIGDGGYTVRGHIGFTNSSQECINQVSDYFLKRYGKPLKKQSAKYQYLICGVDIWDSLFNDYGFNSAVCEEKDVPSTIWEAPKESVAAFIRGLMDTDGYCQKNGVSVQFSSKSSKLVHSLQFLLTKFGIISKVRKTFNKKYQRYYYKLDISGNALDLYHKQIGFSIKYKQDRLEKGIIRTRNTNNDIIPHCLCLDDLLSLRNKYTKIRRSAGHGYSYERQLLAPSKLKAYEISYTTLNKILELTKELCDSEEWIRLKDIYDKNYFYDSVKSLKSGFTETYDVYIPGDHTYFSNGFISHNSFLLAVYATLRALLYPGRKIVICGSVFRQSKVIFEYIESIWRNAPVLRDICSWAKDSGPRHDVDMWRFHLNSSIISALPIGDGKNIRGQRANDVIMDEFASSSEEIFETVIAGFAAVAPNPVENVKEVARTKKSKEYDIYREPKIELAAENQIILAGTAYYAFNHFCRYWNIWRDVIRSRGDENKIKEIYNGEVPKDFNWTDYSIIRLPLELIPEGFMDEAAIARSKATSNSSTYLHEYNTVFVTDSSGFFKRSVIEKCVASEKNKISFKSCGDVIYNACLHGDRDRQYIYGIDPAATEDNFAIVIIELHADHRRVVYCWTTNKPDHSAKKKEGLVPDEDYYTYCVKKIRSLMKVFPCHTIALDAQGGGRAILEAFENEAILEPGEQRIFCQINNDKPQDTDSKIGLHIVEPVQFVDAKWTTDANNGLLSDLENRVILFPYFDSLTLAEVEYVDSKGKLNIDTLEDCVIDIEELKNELSIVVLTETATGRPRWDTPEVKDSNGKKGRLKKDRYSALLMANMAARRLMNTEVVEYELGGGGFATPINPNDINGPLFSGHQVWCKVMDELFS